MKRLNIQIPLLVAGALAIAVASVCLSKHQSSNTPAGQARIMGSESCKECHQRFYELWEPSHHGKAMQPYTTALAQEQLTPHDAPIVIDGVSYQADISGSKGWIVENGPDGTKRYEILHAMGGKNVFFFLTKLDRGRLQVLPLAYRLGPNEWYDTTGSMLRHFGEDEPEDEAIDWRDPLLTFNTACFGCHVSQLSKNYDEETDTYNTVWTEPGINCETCHGPASEHNRVCREAPPGTVPEDLKLPRLKDITTLQWDETCAPCHAKMSPITTTFTPGDRFFDHYGLVTYEDRDFYPDGRDLGENYTYTSWLRSPCVTSGELGCMHCHTSSGRYRFKSEVPAEANKACLPCHQARVDNATAHTHHEAEAPGNKCISCHMPMTAFSHMHRSDHSMLPPTPATTIAFKSPNACNICHADKPPEWADTLVRKWRTNDYQAPVLKVAHLTDEARQGNWTHLDEMLAVISGPDRDQIVATSLIRILQNCPDPRKWPALRIAMADGSPLVRSAAATQLRDDSNTETVQLLLKALTDDFRIVRISAASGLQRYPRARLSPADATRLQAATEEYKTSMMTNPDQWSSHYNMGNYHSDNGDVTQALKSYEKSSKLRPDVIQPLVNASILYARQGKPVESMAQLRKALAIAPENAAVNFNLGLALAEQQDLEGAKRCLKQAVKSDPTMVDAAYNLGVLLAAEELDEGILWLRKAAALQPTGGKYAYTLAFYLNQTGSAAEAITVLERLLNDGTPTANCYLLLASLHEQAGKPEATLAVYRKASKDSSMPASLRRHAQTKLQ
jgi:Tfp pilus assembly protein PilF